MQELVEVEKLITLSELKEVSLLNNPVSTGTVYWSYAGNLLSFTRGSSGEHHLA